MMIQDDSKKCAQERTRGDRIDFLPPKLKTKDPPGNLVSKPLESHGFFEDHCKWQMKASPHRNPTPMSELNFFPINSLKPFQTKWIEKEDDSKICDQESSKCDSIHSLPAKLKSKDPPRVLVSNTLESHGFFNVLDEEGKGKNLQYLTQISEENFEKMDWLTKDVIYRMNIGKNEDSGKRSESIMRESEKKDCRRKNRQRKQKNREEETEEKRNLRRRREREARAEKRKEERKRRKMKEIMNERRQGKKRIPRKNNKQRQKERRKRESEEEKNLRRRKERKARREKRQKKKGLKDLHEVKDEENLDQVIDEKDESRKKRSTGRDESDRKKKNREQMKRKREEETEEKRNLRRRKEREGRIEKREKDNRLKEMHVTTIDESGLAFLKKISESGPKYICFSCERLLYRETVMKYKYEKYKRSTDTTDLLNKKPSDHDNWICQTCHQSLKGGKLPLQSWANGLSLDEIPEELQELRPLEERLISQRIHFMKLIGLPRGGQRAIHGNAVNVPSNLNSIIKLLPRLPDSLEVVPLKLKRRLAYTGHYIYESVRPKKVLEALLWLKKNNPLYAGIDICKDWEEEWIKGDEDLWRAMTMLEENQKKRKDGITDGYTERKDQERKKSNVIQERDTNIEEDEDEEDRKAFEEITKIRGIPYDTLLQEENFLNNEVTYSIAPTEDQKPCSFYQDEKFEELANPCKYPFGRGGLTSERRKRITHRKYFQQRILHSKGIFAKDIDYLLAAQYIVEAKDVNDQIQIALRQSRGQTFQEKRLNAGMMKSKGKIHEMVRTDMAYKFLKNSRGSPAYWEKVLYDLLATVRQIGIPTFFLTLSAADMKWPEVIQSIAIQYGTKLTAEDVKNMSFEEKSKWLRRNPVTAARQFDYRLRTYFTEFLGGKSNPLGKLEDYFIRTEFQQRGSPHAHCLLWIKDAPKIGVNTDEEIASFIDKHQTCEIPEEEGILKELVLSLQRHKHSSACRKRGSCRFKFPHLPSNETLIAREAKEEEMKKDEILEKSQKILEKVATSMINENNPEDISLEKLLENADVGKEEYQWALSIMRSGKKIVLKRKPEERWINYYNRKILETWQGNMDIQFVMDAYSCIMYMTSYMLKSERAMSELLKKVANDNRGEDVTTQLKKVGKAFLNNREVSAQEAAYRLLSLALKRGSRKVVFVNTAPRHKRVSLFKAQNKIEDMNNDEENIFCTSLLDRYEARPNSINQMCLAEFAATYVSPKGEKRLNHYDHIASMEEENEVHEETTQNGNPSRITLKGDLGEMIARKRHCIIRFHKEKQEGEEKYRNLLMLYLPWREEDKDLKNNFSSFKDHYNHAQKVIQTNEKKFSVETEELEEAIEMMHKMEPPQDAWDVIAANSEYQRAIETNEGQVLERDIQNDETENVDLNLGHSSIISELQARFTSERNKRLLLSHEEYLNMMRSLNPKQMEIVKYHRKWCKDTIIALKNHKPHPSYQIFLSGPGGVGKSHIIKLFHYETIRLLSHDFEPDEISVLLTAYTGIAAFAIDGMTIHSALALTPTKSYDYQPPKPDILNTLRSRLGKLKLLIIDEVSMVGTDLLYQIHRRLEDITALNSPKCPFGNISILAVGDLYQLPPVRAKQIFDNHSDAYAKIYGSLWKENFKLFELEEIMRQKDDKPYAELLQRVRTGKHTKEDIELLKTRIVTKTDRSYPKEALHVFPTNAEADLHNEEKINSLNTQIFSIKAVDSQKDCKTRLLEIKMPSKPSETGGLRETVRVAVGAKVMLTCNINVSDGLSNGVTGTIVYINVNEATVQTILVEFDSNRIGTGAKAISQYKQEFPQAVPIQKHTAQFTIGNRKTVHATREQFPFALAWGCTIHKVQGKTLEKIVVTIEENRRFNPGQIYVAISRVTTLKGLYLLEFHEKHIKANPKVDREMIRLRNSELKPSLLIESDRKDSLLRIVMMNIRCYLQHLDDLKKDARIRQSDILCFVETFLKPSTTLSQDKLIIENSTDFRCDRKEKNGGGILCIAKREFFPRDIKTSFQDLEYTLVTLTNFNTRVNIITLYRSPNFNSSDFIDKLSQLLATLERNVLTIILGDFNYDLLSDRNHSILKIMRKYGFHQFVSIPTTDYGTLLDHVYLNSSNKVSIDVTDAYYSDHDVIHIELDLLN